MGSFVVLLGFFPPNTFQNPGQLLQLLPFSKTTSNHVEVLWLFVAANLLTANFLTLHGYFSNIIILSGSTNALIFCLHLFTPHFFLPNVFFHPFSKANWVLCSNKGISMLKEETGGMFEDSTIQSLTQSFLIPRMKVSGLSRVVCVFTAVWLVCMHVIWALSISNQRLQTALCIRKSRLCCLFTLSINVILASDLLSCIHKVCKLTAELKWHRLGNEF